jgi:hypothetical protein
MLSRSVDRLKQWSGVLALFLVLTGGTAWAVDEWTGANIQDGTLTTLDYKNNDIRSADVKSEQLTGQDVKDQSGVDTCTHGTVRFGELCVGVADQHNGWDRARQLCANLELRLPSLTEAHSLVKNYDLPNADATEFFWTEEFFFDPSGDPSAFAARDDTASNTTYSPAGTSHETVCVTTPTN